MARRADTSWGRRLADVTGSLLTALLVFVATPAVLLTLVGDPLAHGLGHQWGHTARLVLAGVALVAWVSWLACCTQLTRAVIDHVRRGDPGAMAGATLTERVAARIAVGVLAMTTLSAPLALTAGAGAADVRGGAPVAQLAVPAAPPAVTAPLPAATTATYVVRPGDSLWTIAQSQLGDGADWGAIAARNLGRSMPGGLRFVDPNQIDAGWILEIPGPALAPPAAEVAAVPTLDSPVHPTTAPAGYIHLPPPRATERPAPHAASNPDMEARPETPDGAGPGRAGLPELMALGIGAIGSAALARRSRRMKLLRRTTGAPFASPTARAIDADVLLARFAAAPALDVFEAANCALADVLADEQLPLDNVCVRAVCVGASGVDFWLADPAPPAPAGLTLQADRSVWHMGHGTIAAGTTSEPFLPIALPVGEDDDGTWLIPLAAGTCVPLLGEAADAFWRAARPVQESWSWSDMVTVTADPTVAVAEARLSGRQILFFGHPASLPAEVAQRISVVTTSPVPGSDLTLLVDRRAATIHPLGRTIRPHLMDAATAEAVEEIVAAPDPGGTEPLPQAEPEICAEASDLALLEGPGIVEVRLLTVTPRLEGLTADLPPNRARRAVELVAYLALHQPDEVTSDRLRTRVLGSADADAAAKTLFNIATAARRAMGTDQLGDPLLPAGSRTGHYRVSSAVSVDVHRAASLAAAGSATEDPELAMGLLRAALALVEGEPLANALSGYTWWEAEGHGARIAAVLVNAACDLAALAVSHNLFDLAQWGLEQARLVEPFSEAISRASMQVAAAAGDADRLRREWRECQRRVDELDPGSTPSPRTERLYAELAKGVLVGAAERHVP